MFKILTMNSYDPHQRNQEVTNSEIVYLISDKIRKKRVQINLLVFPGLLIETRIIPRQ